MKRILTIQDISCVGKCSLTVALPVISAMGVECCVLPTAVLSNHTAFSAFTFRDLTQDIEPICQQWKKEKIHFDAIYTGYLGSFEQIELMFKLIEDFGGKDTITIVDPCMADNGKLYSGFTPDFAKKMAQLCGKAHVILPNLTEASYLLGIPYKESGYDKDYVEKLLRDLAATGAKKVVLKGVDFNNGRLGIASYDSKTQAVSWYFHEKMPERFHGTGDTFASVLTGALMRGFSLDQASRLAADFVVQAIKKTLEHGEYNWYGVDFESALPGLIGELNEAKS